MFFIISQLFLINQKKNDFSIISISSLGKELLFFSLFVLRISIFIQFYLEVVHNFIYHMLQVGSEERIHVYYAHGQDNPTFVRRCYWLLDKYVLANWLIVGHAYPLLFLFWV